MRFTWPQISRILLVSRATLWRRVRNIQSFSSRCYYTSLTDLDELLGEIRRGFPNCGISLTIIFHVAVRLFSNRSQMTSKCGKNKKVAKKVDGDVNRASVL